MYTIHVYRVCFNGSLWFVFKSIFSFIHFRFCVYANHLFHINESSFRLQERNEHKYNSHFQMKQLTCSVYPICSYKCTNGIYLIISFLFRAPNALFIIENDAEKDLVKMPEEDPIQLG